MKQKTTSCGVPLKADAQPALIGPHLHLALEGDTNPIFGLGPDTPALAQTRNQAAVIRQKNSDAVLRETRLAAKIVDVFDQSIHGTSHFARYCVRVNARDNVKAQPARACYKFSMENDWLERLFLAVEEDPRSANKLSSDAGLGRNYIQQLIKDGKKPGSEKLASILDALGEEQAFFVLTGLRISPRDLEFVHAVSKMDARTREHALEILKKLGDTPAEPTQSSSYAPGDETTLEES